MQGLWGLWLTTKFCHNTETLKYLQSGGKTRSDVIEHYFFIMGLTMLHYQEISW